MSEEVMQYEVRAGQAMAELRQLQQEQQALGRLGNAALKQLAKGHEEAGKEAVSHFGKVVSLGAEIKKLQKEIAGLQSQMGGLNAGGGKTNAMVQQLAYAADDAAISFSTGGFSGAIRGASNNLSTMAMMLNPMAGAVVGVGLAIGSVLAKNLLDSKDATDEQNKAFEEGVKMAAAYRKEILSLDESILSLSGHEEEAAAVRAQARREEVLAPRKKALLAAEEKAAAKQKEVDSVDQLIKQARRNDNNAKGGGMEVARLEERRGPLADQLVLDRLDAAREQRNLDAVSGKLDEEEALKLQKVQRDRGKKQAERAIRAKNPQIGAAIGMGMLLGVPQGMALAGTAGALGLDKIGTDEAMAQLADEVEARADQFGNDRAIDIKKARKGQAPNAQAKAQAQRDLKEARLRRKEMEFEFSDPKSAFGEKIKGKEEIAMRANEKLIQTLERLIQKVDLEEERKKNDQQKAMLVRPAHG